MHYMIVVKGKGIDFKVTALTQVREDGVRILEQLKWWEAGRKQWQTSSTSRGRVACHSAPIETARGFHFHSPLLAALNSKPNQRVGDRSRGRGEFILCVSFVMFPFERPPLSWRSQAEKANDAVFHRILRSVQ